jgi:hypothetical protein
VLGPNAGFLVAECTNLIAGSEEEFLYG